MNGVLLWFAGLVMLLLGAAFAVPYAVDWNTYRGVFEEEASRMLGREVRVGGNVNLRLLPAPYVSFERPRISDTDPGEAFFRAESFTMWLALPPLVQGIFEAKQIELKQPSLRLQVDKNGGGNWQQFRISQGALPFVPRGLALQSVKITDGVVALHGVDGDQLARIGIRDADLSAPSIEGPYRFRADMTWNGVEREIRGSTAPPDADGVRLKLAARTAQNGNAYLFDGVVRDLGNRPRVDGEIIATIAPAAAAAAEGQQPAPGQGFEIRAQLAADTLAAQLKDVAFSFEQAGRPQLLTGTAEAQWSGRPRITANLSSRWLDLEKISGAPSDATAFETARRLGNTLRNLLPETSEVAARLAVDQANFAGEQVSGLVAAFEDSGSGLQIRELRAGLPGGTRLDFSGALRRDVSGNDELEGDLVLRGAHLGRLMHWATRGSVSAQTRGDGSFALSSRMKLSRAGIEFRQAELDANANRLTGEFGYKWGARPKLTLTADTRRADLSTLLPGILSSGLLNVALNSAAQPAGQSAPSLNGLLPDLATFDARLNIRADTLTDGTQTLKDVDAQVLLQSGTLTVPRLRAATASGFKLDLDGEIKGLGSQSKGTLRGVVEAQTPSAMDDALRLAAIDPASPRASWMARFAPLRLAFVSRLGNGGPTAAELNLDGMVRGAPLVASLTLDGGWSGWRTAPVDGLVVSESAEVARLAQTALSGSSASGGDAEAYGRGRLLLKVVGTPAQGVTTLVQMSAPDLQVDVQGRGSVLDDLSLRFDGEADVASADAAKAFQFAGLRQPAAAIGLGVRGRVGVAVTDAGLKIAADKFEVGSSRVSGTVAVSGPERARRFDIALKTDDISLPRLFGLMLDGRRAPSQQADEVLGSHWREEPFDFTNLDNVTGSLRIETDALTLEEGFGLSAASLEAEFTPELITVSKLEGRALGGAVSSAFKLERGAAGAKLSGVFGLWDVQLAKIVGASEIPIGTGAAQLSVQFSGQAMTPRALISVVTGKGELELKQASMQRLAPGAIESTAEAVLTGRVVPRGEALQQGLRQAFAEGPLPMGDRTVAVDLGEGALRVRAFEIDTPKAVVTNQTTIDLGELKIDTEWKFAPKPAARITPAQLPGVSVIYVGPLVSYASLEPRIISDALEREMAVRGMERDVEQLERLRREDEARAKAEAERQRAIELQHQQDVLDMQRRQAEEENSSRVIDVPLPIPARPVQPQSLQTPPTPPQPQSQPPVADPRQSLDATTGAWQPSAPPGRSSGPVEIGVPPVPPLAAPPKPAERRPFKPVPTWEDQWPRPSRY